MANTTHNPITTKWSGAVGGFRYGSELYYGAGEAASTGRRRSAGATRAARGAGTSIRTVRAWTTTAAAMGTLSVRCVRTARIRLFSRNYN